MPLTPTTPLADIQSLSDGRGIAIQEVGLWDVVYPLEIQIGDWVSRSIGKFSLVTQLAPEKKGTHMSRLMSWLHQASRHMDLTQLASQGSALLDLLGAQEGVLRVDWMGFLEKAAPMSGEKSLMNYPLKLAVYWYRDAETQLHLTLEVPVKSLCPASKAMAHSGAHSQRAKIIATVRITQALEFDIQKTLQELERCGSAALFAVLKREDEKYITEEAYAHPKFVEDMVREAASVCHQLPGVAGFMVEVENQESIHNHSVYAKIVHAMKAKP